MGTKDQSVNVRLPESYTARISELEEQGQVKNRTDFMYDAAEEFHPFLGRVHLWTEWEGETETVRIKYSTDDEMGRFLETADDFRIKPGYAIKNAVAYYLGDRQIDVDDEIVKTAALRSDIED